MDEKEIRKIIRDEIQKNTNTSQYSSMQTSSHAHNGIDAPRVNQVNIEPSTRVSGSITFASIKTYILNINANPNPTLILCYGIVVDSASSPTVRAHTFGTAQLGKSYFLQPSSGNSVITGGPLQQFIQSSSYLSVDNSANVHALTDEGHLVDVEYGGTIHARLTLAAFDSESVTLKVTHLDSGWNIIVNLVII